MYFMLVQQHSLPRFSETKKAVPGQVALGSPDDLQRSLPTQPFCDSVNLLWENTHKGTLFLEHKRMQLSLCHVNQRPNSTYKLEHKPAQPFSVTLYTDTQQNLILAVTENIFLVTADVLPHHIVSLPTVILKNKNIFHYFHEKTKQNVLYYFFERSAEEERKGSSDRYFQKNIAPRKI